MRNVPIAEFKDRCSEFVAAAEAGEDIIITRHGREVARVTGISDEKHERKRAAAEALSRIGQAVLARQGSTTAAEIRGWIGEGRR